MWASFSSGIVGHYRAKGGETASRVQTALNMTKRTSGVSFRDSVHFIVLGVRHIRVLRVVGGRADWS